MRFKILYSEEEDATVSDSKTIEREVSQDLSVEIPEEVLRVISGLSWTGTLGLKVEINGSGYVNLKDATVNQGRLEKRNSEVGRETPIYGKRNYPFWQFWHWLQ